MKTTVPVNTELLIWAINRAGYKLDQFFEKFTRARGWLEGEKQPTIPQLRDFANKVHLSFGYLLLDEPPREEIPIPFYRTIKNGSEQLDVNIRDTILTLQKRQDWLRDYRIDMEEDTLPFVGAFSLDTGVDELVKDVREKLDLKNHWAREFSNWQKALNHLAQKVEEAGIIIVFNSVVDNNTHRSVKVEDCRGFVLVDDDAPFMFVNSADSKAAQMFTIVHELAHIWIGESAGFDFRKLQPANQRVEQFCDRVAAQFLVPKSDFENAWIETQSFQDLAKMFKVSHIVVARRALDLGKISKRQFFEFYDRYTQRVNKKKENREPGGDFYATLKKRLNVQFVATVNRALRDNKLLYREAFDLTGLKAKTYDKAIEEFGL